MQDRYIRPKARRCLFARTVVADRIAGLRALLRGQAVRAGLDEQAADDFVFAANEAMTNAVRHGGGRGIMRLWRNGDLLCEISDQGPGAACSGAAVPTRAPTPSAEGGLGLWLAAQLSDSIAVDSGKSGTTVRIRAALPALGG